MLGDVVDVELDATPPGQAGESAQRGFVFSALKAGDGRPVHAELARELKLGQAVLDAAADHPGATACA